MTLNDKLQIEAEKLAMRFDINYKVALTIVCAGADIAMEHIQESFGKPKPE